MKRTPFCCLLTLALCWIASRPALADDPTPSAPLPPVVARYEQMLATSLAKGTAFDKVYQHFFEGPGLDALAARWQARAAAGGPGAETFPLLVGLLAERRAHPDEARRAYGQYNAAHPDDPRGWTALGELESAEGHFGPAADALSHALAPGVKPPVPVSTRPTLYRELARAQARSFLTAASLGTWRKLAAEFPEDPGILQEVGEALQEDQAYDEARATFEKVRELARKNNDAFGRINATLRTGQVEEARGHATEAVKIYEGVVAEAKTGSWLEREARARIEQLYRGQEDLPGLADYYKKWLEDHPKDTEVATRRAAVLIELNRRAEAIDLLKQAVVWAPERQELQVELARRLSETDRPAEGAAVMEKLTAVAPEEKSYWQLLGDARWQMRETLPANAPAADRDSLKAQALAAWSHLSHADGKDPAATGQLADLLASHRLRDEALTQYARAAALAPDLPDARERWAGYLAQLDRKDEARQVVAGLVTARPTNATAANYARLASALDRLDDSPGALAATEHGLALEPHNFDLLSQRWQLLAERKRWADAAALYPALLAAAPNPYFAEQVQARQVAALQAANQVADTRKGLAARLGDNSTPLDANDLALLVRIDIQSTGSDNEADGMAQAKQALAEARARFPRDAAFARLEGELAKRNRDPEGQVAALRRLIDLQPAQKTDALAEIARVWRDAARPDDAVAAANELVLASPANASAQLLLADLLLQGGHPEEGVARLRDAVRLSDKPNEVRLRLARVQSDLGRDADARRTLDEAFEDAGDAHERLAITKPLAEAYQRENHLDELITRFQTLQQGDAEGWRYALYLAEIYQETKDYGAARRELAKALAARPHDGALLRQLVRIAEEEQNSAEIARYQALLAEVEPSDQNKLALVSALLENNQADAGFNALRANLAAILKTPGAWDQLLPLLARNDLTTKAGDLLNAEMGGDRADIKARFTLALFQAVAGNVEQARTAFWSVFDTKTGPAPLTPPVPRKNPASAGASSNMHLYSLVYSGDSIPEQRYRAGELSRRTAQGLLYPGGLSSYGRARGTFAMPMMAAGLPNTPSLTDTTRDAALIYLAALAVQDHTAAEFIAELDRHLAARDSSRADRLVAYSLMQDVDSQTREIAAQIHAPEPGLDGLALARTAMIAFGNSPQYRRYSEVPPLTPAQDNALAPLFDPLLARTLQGDPALDATESPALQYSFLVGIEHKAEADAVRRDFLAHVDAQAPLERLETALGLLLEGNFAAAERAQLKTLVPAFAEASAKAVGRSGPSEAYYYPAIVFQEGSEAGKLSPEDFADTLASLIPLWYPRTTPTASSLASMGGSQYSVQNAETALPPTRFFDPNMFQTIQSVAQSLHQGEAARLPAVLARLDQQTKDLPPERRIYPQIVAVYLEALNGEPPAGLSRAQALLTAAPDDNDARLITGILLGRADHHAEALALLNSVDVARTGESPFAFQKIVLAEAKAAKDTESAKRAALRLAAMRVPADEREFLSGELRELGLTEQADVFAKPVASVGPAGSGSGRSVFDSTTAQQLERFTADKNEAGALALVCNVLAALPPPLPNGNNYNYRYNFDYVLRATMATLKKFNKTDEFIADAEKQIAKDPDSLSLNYQLALLHQEGDAADTQRVEKKRVQRPPVWLKLTRLDTGEIAGFYSTDGKDWQEIGRAKVTLGDAPLAVLPAASAGKASAPFVTAEQITLIPPPPETLAATSSDAVLPAPWTETQLPDESDTPPPPASWHDGVFTLHAQGWDLWGSADDARLVHRPLGAATEFAARIVAMDDSSMEIKTGVMLRAGLSPDAPYAAVVVLPNGTLSFQHRDHGDQATAYWRKLADLRPKEFRYGRLLARRLAGRGLRDEAVAIYDHLIDQAPEEALSAYDDIQLIYKGRRMVALAERLLAWKPPVAISSAGPRNYGYTFFQVARECVTQKRPDLVIAACRRGIELDTANGYVGQDTELYKLLTTTLLEQNRRDEARDALIANFVPTASTNPAAANANAMQLGFRSVTARSYSSRSWMANISWSQDSIELYGLRPLEGARSAGLLPDLQAALQTRIAADPEASAENDLPWLLMLIRLDLHDPSVLPSLPEILNGKPDAKKASARNFYNVNDQGEIAVRLAVARRLLQWPGHESLALEAFGSAQAWVANARKNNNALSPNLLTAINFQQVRAQLALDDPRSAAATLRAMSAEIAAANASNGGGNYDELRRYLGLLLRAGPEADPVYLDVFKESTKTLETRKNLYFAYDLEKNVRLGDNPRFQAFAWLLDDGGSSADSPDATLVYELRPEHPFDKSGLGKYPGSRERSFPGSEGERTLTFSYGPDPEHFAPVGQLKTDRTFGTWTGPIPHGAGVVKVSIETPRAKDAAALAAEAATPSTPTPTPSPSPAPSPSPTPAGTPAPAAGPSGDYWLPVVRTPNLLTNPDFDGLANRDPNAETFALPGWKDLPAGLWKTCTGDNPRPGRPFVQSDTFTPQSHLILGARIPLEAGKTYFQSGWVRDGSSDNSTVRVGRRYLDTDGNVLKTSECPEFSTIIWRWHSQRLALKAGKGDDAIPTKAAFIEPFLRVQGSNEWTGLFLGKVD